ncbi:MAG: hypothetical protein FJZ60_01550 [Chlamydiae bacterium]|nr:hypothetical protein [Chlamydiota bacterium]
MRHINLKKIPLLLASLGIFAGIHAQNRVDDKVPADCSNLCLASPAFDCAKDFDFLAAAIYEQIRVQGGEIGFLTYSRDQALYPVNGYGVYQPEFFSWGFKVGAGYSGWSEGWRTAIKYSYFSAISDLPFQTAYGSAIVPSTYSNNFVSDYSQQYFTSFGNLQAGNKTTINDIKFTIGRPTRVTDLVSIDAYYCVEATLIMRRQVQVFTNDVAFGPNSVPVWTNGSPTAPQQRFASASGGYYQNYQKYSWWGVGPLVGLKGNYFIGRGVGVYGDVSGRLLYGNSGVRASTAAAPKTRLNNPGNNAILETPGLEAITVNSLYQFCPAIETELGISWSYTFDEEQIRASFQIGYENLFYFMVMRTVVNEIPTRSESGAGIGTQGLVLQGSIEF